MPFIDDNVIKGQKAFENEIRNVPIQETNVLKVLLHEIEGNVEVQNGQQSVRLVCGLVVVLSDNSKNLYDLRVKVIVSSTVITLERMTFQDGGTIRVASTIDVYAFYVKISMQRNGLYY